MQAGIHLFRSSLIFALALLGARPLSSYAVTPGIGFHDRFDRVERIEEAGSPAESTSPDWWVNSGGRMIVDSGTAGTIRGALAFDNVWRTLYAVANPRDTDDGAHPQNIFRLVTRGTWKDYRQQVFFRIRSINLSASPERNAWSGVLLFAGYRDSNNLYYAGIRADGNAVIKKKVGGVYVNLAQPKVYPGVYDRGANPCLIPLDRWIGLRTVVSEDGSGAVRIRLEIRDDALGATWIAVADVDDAGTGGPALTGPAHAGIRTDYFDVELDDYRIDVDGGTLEATPAGSSPIGIFRPSDGTWQLDANHDGVPERSIVYGRAGDIQVPADYDGDGLADLAVHRPSYGGWFVDTNQNGGTDIRANIGVAGDVPVPADYDGNGRADFAVFHPADGTWHLDANHDGAPERSVVYGRTGDIPVPADYDGDGVTDFAVYRPSYGGWFIDTNRNGGTDRRATFGSRTDLPAVGDYDGDGRADIAVFGPTTGTWLIDTNGDGSADRTVAFGRSGDVAVPADYDGDGVTDVAVFRTSTGEWLVDTDRNGGTDLDVTFGQAGDAPLRMNSWVFRSAGFTR